MPKLVVALVALLLPLLATPAGAATISADASTITITSGDEAEGFETYESGTIDFTPKTGGAALTAAGACTQDGADVHCPKRPIVANLGGGNDVASFSVAGVTVEVHGGTGNDDIRSGPSTDRIFGDDGQDNIEGGVGADTVDGGPGNDSMSTFDSGDVVNGGADLDEYTFYSYGDGLVISLDDAANDGPASGAKTANVHSDVESIQASPQRDILVGNANSQALHGNAGNDDINGGGGVDELRGDAGDDEVNSFDDVADDVGCGDGNDHATIDSVDKPSDDCERVEIFGPDADGDGVKPPLDCDDNHAPTHPGGNDIPGNGRDEDCSGADAPLLDRDGDGVTSPPDCDDSNRARHQGATDIPQNGIDEDCDNVDAPWPRLLLKIELAWDFVGSKTKLTRFRVLGVPAGVRVEVRCRGRGCPFARKRFSPRRGRVDVRSRFRRPLSRGAVVEMRVLAPAALGPVKRATIRGRNQRPRTSDLCIAPRASRPERCV